ncbi:MAG TPA: 50S ribosomal protein L37e [Candidatus Nanoarchaeia archaeon]|nr:50S ribosomal protein L37e [Candidatus Nanoarchaeia archaeon]
MKGTHAHGRKTGKKTHIRCRRCGRHSYHAQHKVCSYCWFPSARMKPHIKTRKHDF